MAWNGLGCGKSEKPVVVQFWQFEPAFYEVFMTSKQRYAITEGMWIPEEEEPVEGLYNVFTRERMLIAEDGLPTTGFLRLEAVLTILPVSRSTWYAGIKKGIYPQPSKKLGERIAMWHVDDIRQLVSKDT